MLSLCSDIASSLCSTMTLFFFSPCQNLCIKTNPQWREKFEFNRFEDGQADVLLVELCCKKGRKCEECLGV